MKRRREGTPGDAMRRDPSTREEEESVAEEALASLGCREKGHLHGAKITNNVQKERL